MPMGDEWIDVTRAYQDADHLVTELDNRSIRSIEDLIAHGLFNLSFYKRMLEFVEGAKSPGAYVMPGKPKFTLPFRPRKIIGIGSNYRAHVQEMGSPMPAEPLFFTKATTACIGPRKPIELKSWYGRVDHEGELAVLIGKRAKDVKEENAMNCVAGYTIVNDVTARDLQSEDKKAGHPWFRSKSLDTFCPMGPVVAFPEALPDPLEVDIEVRVNGEIRQKSNTRDFIFSLPEIIAHVTKFMTLEPGDVIATGTPEGVSQIHPGDKVEVCIPGIGTLSNPVIEV